MCALVLGVSTWLDCRVWVKFERENLERKKGKVDIDYVSPLFTSSIAKPLTTSERPLFGGVIASLDSEACGSTTINSEA